MRFEIYCNYGVTGAEKRNVYTCGGEHYNAVCSDKLTVESPEGWEVYENIMGNLMVTAPWGWTYEINDVLSGNIHPYFEARNENGELKRVKLKVIE